MTDVQTNVGESTYRNAYTYENDRIKTVSHNTTTDTPDVTYTFNYDALGRKTSVQVGNQTLPTNVYSDNRSGLLTEVQYGNGDKVAYTYDDYDRLTGVKYDGETADRYTYESLFGPAIKAFTQGDFSKLKEMRFDEPWDQRARRAGVSYYYKRYPDALYDRLRQ